jgi:hypothetical protein
MGTLHESLCRFMVLSRLILFRKKNVSEKFAEKNKTYFMYKNLFRKSCRLWHNVEKYCRTGQATGDNITQRMSSACWITKATDARSECEILIAFQQQQWLRECALMLRLYVHCLSFYLISSTISMLYINNGTNECSQVPWIQNFFAKKCTLYWNLKCYNLHLQYLFILPLHVSVHSDHHQGAYAGTFSKLQYL